MKLSFNLSYKTVWGQSLHAVLYRAQAGANERKINVPLSTQDGKNWSGEILLLLKQPLELAYHYEVRCDGKAVRREWQTVPRRLHLNPTATAYTLQDQWRNQPDESWLYSSAVTDVFAPHANKTQKPLALFAHTVVLRAQTPRPNRGGKLYLCGSCPAWGAWDPQKALQMQEGQLNEWSISCNADDLPADAQYKFLLKENHQILWEEGPNRHLKKPGLKTGEAFVQSDLRPRFAPEKTPLRGAGVVLPVFSLRSENSWGVGDFGDLKQLADWAEKTGQKVLQILPINDTSLTGTWQDSYPYNAVSVYAFHPLYADMRPLPATDKKTAKKWEERRKKLNALPQVDYEAALALKMERLKHAFSAEGAAVLAGEAFRRFYAQNLHWLPAYAMFCVLRERYHTANFNTWPEHRTYSSADNAAFCAPASGDYAAVCFWYYVQFILHSQLTEAVRYARQKGIILKGDIPIGVSPHSADAWAAPQLFCLNAQAGAPPDDFSVTGQNWGLPTYNWDVMAQDGYRWWKQRFTFMARYFDAYRIDHVLGFFRIWEIPMHSVEGLLGQFVPALPLNAAEIAGFGLPFHPDFLTPHITDALVNEKFGAAAADVKARFLTALPNGGYRLKPEYATQRQIEAALTATDEKTARLKKGLFALASNVLFVPDRQQAGYYHPRIAALTDEFFHSLSSAEQGAFARLYNEYFFKRHNDFWKEQAMKKLPSLTQATRMLCCAEDLGMIPDCVPEVLKELQILSLEIERMPKRLGETFADTREYPYLSVATPSTHDMSVLRGWWKENRTLTTRFWREVLGHPGEAPADLDAQTAEEILRLHLNSPSMLALISYQDWTAMDKKLRAKDPEAERINVPANPRHYWRYRMPITLEKLLKETAFNEKIKQMIAASGR